MPRYTYHCECGVSWDAYAGYDDASLPCSRCGRYARRQAVYADQYISAETGPKGGKKNDPPRDEKDLRKPFREFREASQEAEYAYSRVNDPKVKAPNYYKEGVKRAKKINPKVRG